MNFAEGVKRVYVVLACLFWVAWAIALFEDRPREDSNYWTTADALKDDIAEGMGKTRYGVTWGDKSNSEFIKETCSHPATQYSEKRKELCRNYNHAQTELPKALAYHAAYSLGVLALVALGASLLWMLMAWIGRGFLAKKN